MKHRKIWLPLLLFSLLLTGHSAAPASQRPLTGPEHNVRTGNQLNRPAGAEAGSPLGWDRLSPNPSREPVPSSDSEPLPFTPQILAENDACSVSVTGVEVDDMWGYQLQLELVNKTDHQNLIFMMQDVFVNETGCDPTWACEVQAGKRASSEVIWLAELLTEKGISKVSEIVFTLQIYDSENLARNDLLKETIVLFQE